MHRLPTVEVLLSPDFVLSPVVDGFMIRQADKCMFVVAILIIVMVVCNYSIISFFSVCVKDKF